MKKTEPGFVVAALAAGFVLRATIALQGDAMIHPDEIHQVLEPAHKLVFGSGYTWPEFHYGARQWWLAGLAAAVMWMSEAVGAGEPRIYLPAIELVFCALSLLVPYGMYRFATQAYGERTGRLALVAGVGWYELVVLAPKPMTEFVAAGPLLLLMAAAARKEGARTNREAWWASGLAAATGALRMQYAPVAAAMLCIVAWRSRAGRRWVLAGSLAALAIAVGAVDGWIWDGTPFHSYLTNARWNLAMPRPGETPAWLILVQAAGASLGAGLVMLAVACARPKRYGWIVLGAGMVIALHLVPGHKEYRFFYIVIPLWLVVGADVLARARRPMRRVAGASFALLSAAGLMEMLPLHKEVWRSTHTPGAVEITFKDTDPVITLYRWLRTQENLEGIWHRERKAVTLNGWSLLHRAVPWYDESQGRARRLDESGAWASEHVSHIVTSDPRWSLRGFDEVKQIGRYRVHQRRLNADKPVRKWKAYRPNMAASWPEARLLEDIAPGRGKIPECHGIEIEGAREDWCRGMGINTESSSRPHDHAN